MKIINPLLNEVNQTILRFIYYLCNITTLLNYTYYLNTVNFRLSIVFHGGRNVCFIIKLLDKKYSVNLYELLHKFYAIIYFFIQAEKYNYLDKII